jgi:hypothetical protein
MLEDRPRTLGASGMVGRDAALAAGVVLLLTPGALAAPGDLDAFFADARKLDGKTLTIKTSNGPTAPGMSAELHVDGEDAFSVTTSIRSADGTATLFSQETYRFHRDQPGLVAGHFRTEFTRANARVSIPLVCDTFLFLSQSLQLDCYRPQNFRPERQAYRLEFTVVWELKPELFNIRIISSDGAAALSTPR